MQKTGILILGVLILLVFIASVSAETMGEVKLKSRTLATALAVIGPLMPAFAPISVQEGLGGEEWFFDRYMLVPQGVGQLCNGQYLKAGGFLLNAVIGTYLVYPYIVGSIYEDTSYLNWYLGHIMVLGGYVLSIIDANLSAKKINQKRLKSGTNNLNSAPPQILIGSYNLRF